MKALVFIILLILLTLCGCSSLVLDSASGSIDGATVSPTMQTNRASNLSSSRTLTIYAAASLTDAFREIGKEFETTNPGVKIEYSFAGSQILRTQLEQGALADIFASADHKNMDLLITENLVVSNSVQDIMTNRLIVILPPGNPAGIEKLQDLSRSGLKIVLADGSVPAGNYARQVLINLSKDPAYGVEYSLSVLGNVVSNETDVRQVVTKIELGEADAGIVYASDAIAAPELATISIPTQYNVTARYPVAILANSTNPDLALAYIESLKSPAGQEILKLWGFSPGQ